MRRLQASACLATFILVGRANAVDHEQKEQAAAAREKSAVLEEKASAEGSKTQPTLTALDETIQNLSGRALCVQPAPYVLVHPPQPQPSATEERGPYGKKR
jgi:hypothetical protein